MNNSTNQASPRIHVLREAVFKKIAAGEVIDRPASVIRELIDNSIDSGATEINVEIEEGGLKRIVVSDNGCGIHPEDMEICYLPHTTSKIETEKDLMSINTLGFRGEALSSISTVSLTKIYSTYKESKEGKYILIENGQIRDRGPAALPEGTRIEVERIFENYPARKRFLKSPATEASMCKKVFLEKVLAFPSINFRLIKNGSMDVFLAAGSILERISAAYPSVFKKEHIKLLEEERNDMSIKLVLLSPSFPQRDRRNIYIYINGRNIQEYSLMQAIAYGYREVLPGGQFPAAVLFANIPAEEVDFNIHPAKKEAKIRVLPQLHNLVSRSIYKELREWFVVSKPTQNKEDTQRSLDIKYDISSSSEHYLKKPAKSHYKDYTSEPVSAYIPSTKSRDTNKNSFFIANKKSIDKDGISLPGIKYLGQLFNTFLVIEKEESLFLIDQHAAHERILYNRLKSTDTRQKLLIPHNFEIEENEKHNIEDKKKEAESIGIAFTIENNTCTITHLPQPISGNPSIAEKWLRQESTTDPQVDTYASIACKAAIKEGDSMDSMSAIELAEKTFSLPEPFCPHGRPVWIKLTRKELYKMIKRIV